jgi:hypothetical protein
MSCIRQELDRYLAIRRSLGYDLGTTARLLRRFAAFAETQGAEHVNTDLFLKWQASFGQASHQTWAARLGMVRLFAQWLHGLDPGGKIAEWWVTWDNMTILRALGHLPSG